MKISSIIPVFNVEQYLPQCVESISCQTYRDIEIILVDDGSPDDCPAICDEIASKDSRVKVIHKPNGGLSDARNVGLNAATGDYVVFVDGDDFWRHNDDLEKLVEVLRENPEADFIQFNAEYFYPDSGKYTKWVAYDEALNGTVDKNVVTCALVASGTFPMSACFKMMKREFLMDNELFFVKDQIAEDIPWFINVLDATSHCCFINHYIYAYRQNVTGSISNIRGKKSFDSLFDIFKTELARIDKRSFCDEAKIALKSFLAYEYCILLTYNGIDKATQKELLKYKNILTCDLNPKVKKASTIYKYFGIGVTTMVLKCYQWMRSNRK